MGRMKTLDKIKRRYYWPNQYVFVEKQVNQFAGIFYCVHHNMTMVCQYCCICQPIFETSFFQLNFIHAAKTRLFKILNI